MAHLPTLRQLQYLIALSETLHFGKAAEKMHVSQSAFSTGISELENQLGLVLIERDSRNVRLTSTASHIVDQAKKILNLTEQMVDFSEQSSHLFARPFKLAVIPSIMPFVLNKLNKNLTEQVPEAILQLQERQSLDALKRLEDAEVDAILMALPFDTKDFHVDVLFEEELFWVGHKTGHYAPQQYLSFDEINLDDMILLEEGHCLTQHTLTACQHYVGNSHLNLHVHALSITSLIELLKSGYGYAFLPNMAVEHDLIKLADHLTYWSVQPAPTRQIALVSRKASLKKQEIAALTNLLKQ